MSLRNHVYYLFMTVLGRRNHLSIFFLEVIGSNWNKIKSKDENRPDLKGLNWNQIKLEGGKWNLK